MGFNFSVDFCTACSLSQLGFLERMTPEILLSVLPRVGHNWQGLDAEGRSSATAHCRGLGSGAVFSWNS